MPLPTSTMTIPAMTSTRVGVTLPVTGVPDDVDGWDTIELVVDSGVAVGRSVGSGVGVAAASVPESLAVIDGILPAWVVSTVKERTTLCFLLSIVALVVSVYAPLVSLLMGVHV